MNETKTAEKGKIINTILESLTNGCSIIKSCKAADIMPVTLWRWRKKSKKLDESIEAIMESRVQVIEDALFMEAAKGNTTLIMFYLQNRAAHKWQDKRHLNVQTDKPLDFNIKIVRPDGNKGD